MKKAVSLLALSLLASTYIPTAARAQEFRVAVAPLGCGSVHFQSGPATLTVDANGKLCMNALPPDTAKFNQPSVTVATTSTLVLAAGAATGFLVIENPSTATQSVWLRFDGNVATGAPPDFELKPGQSILLDTRLPTSAIYGIVASGTQALSILYY